MRTYDKSIISGVINGHPGDRVNPIRIESCESFRMRAEAFISDCLAITNDSNGSGIIKSE